jgi:hypothetical protein
MEQKKVRVPRKGERVHIDDGTEVFEVLQVHNDSQMVTARSLKTKATRPLVPWDSLHRLNEDASQAAARIVREATES